MESEKVEQEVVEESYNINRNNADAHLDLNSADKSDCIKGTEFSNEVYFENVANSPNIIPDENITSEEVNRLNELTANNKDLHSAEAGNCVKNCTELGNEYNKNVADSLNLTFNENTTTEQVNKLNELTSNNVDVGYIATNDCVNCITELRNEVHCENVANGLYITDENITSEQVNRFDELTTNNEDLHFAEAGNCVANGTELGNEYNKNVADNFNITTDENVTTEQVNKLDELTANSIDLGYIENSDCVSCITELGNKVHQENLANSLNITPEENIISEQVNTLNELTANNVAGDCAKNNAELGNQYHCENVAGSFNTTINENMTSKQVNNDESTAMETTMNGETVQFQGPSEAMCEQNQEGSASNDISDSSLNIKVKQEVMSDDEDVCNDDVELLELEEDNLIALSSTFDYIKSETKIKVEEIDMDVDVNEEFERRIYECPKCQEKFVLECLYLFHVVVIHDRVKPYACMLCKFKSPNSVKFLSHLRRHTKEKKKLCKICQKHYYYWEVSKHLQNCPLPTTYNCNLCEFCTRKRYEFLEHIRLHTGERPYKCRRCGVGFISCSVLKKHFRVHINEKYSCHICERQFRTPSSRDRHVVTYASKKCLKCDYVAFSCKDFYLHFKCSHIQSKFRKKLDTMFRRLASQLLRESTNDIPQLCENQELLQPFDGNYETSDNKEDLRGILYSNLNLV